MNEADSFERDETQPYGIKLPTPLPWKDRPTVFKLPPPSEKPRWAIQCQGCGDLFPLTDYLEGELNETECPKCGLRTTPPKRRN